MPLFRFLSLIFFISIVSTSVIFPESETTKQAVKSEENKIVVKGSRRKTASNDAAAAQDSVNATEIEEKQSVTTGDAVKEMTGVYQCENRF